jgi:hypothetical protein
MLPKKIDLHSYKKLLNKYFFPILLYLAVVCYPLQTASVEYMSSTYDLSCFIFIIYGFLACLNSKHEALKNLSVLTTLFIYELILFKIFKIEPTLRLLSAVIWLFGIYLAVGANKFFKYDQIIVSKIIILMGVLSAIYILSESMLIETDRPRALFAEPSLAGLALNSTALGIFAFLDFKKYSNNSLFYMLLIIILIISSLITKSVSLFILTPLFIFISFHKFRFSRMLFILFILAVILFYILKIEHYSDRLLFLTNASLNSSVLSWLRGLDQMLYVLMNSPLLGFGLGNTGQFDFISQRNIELNNLDANNLNINDGYSMLFRLIIEAGLLPLGIFIIYLINRINLFVIFLNNNNNKLSVKYNNAIIFNFVFSLSLLIGILIKEPIYSRSIFYLSIFLIFTVPICSHLTRTREAF